MQLYQNIRIEQENTFLHLVPPLSPPLSTIYQHVSLQSDYASLSQSVFLPMFLEIKPKVNLFHFFVAPYLIFWQVERWLPPGERGGVALRADQAGAVLHL